MSMKSAKEKVAYLRGLAKGLEVEESTKEGKLLYATLDVLSALAEDLEELEDTVAELSEQVDAVDEDLDTLETEVYGDEDDEDEESFYEITCQNCNEEFCVDEDTLMEGMDGGEITCPNCGEKVEFELECDCDDECCGHGGKKEN